MCKSAINIDPADFISSVRYRADRQRNHVPIYKLRGSSYSVGSIVYLGESELRVFTQSWAINRHAVSLAATP